MKLSELLNEAQYAIEYVSNRIPVNFWININNPKGKQIIVTDNEHINYLRRYPETFGLNRDDVKNMYNYSDDSFIKAFKDISARGWIRGSKYGDRVSLQSMDMKQSWKTANFLYDIEPYNKLILDTHIEEYFNKGYELTDDRLLYYLKSGNIPSKMIIENQIMLNEKFNVHPFYENLYYKVHTLFLKRFSSPELLNEVNNLFEQFARIVIQYFKKENIDNLLYINVASRFDKDFNAATSTKYDKKDNMFTITMTFDILYSKVLQDWLQGSHRMEDKYIDYYTQMLTSNFFHEIEHVLQEINIKDKTKLGSIKQKQSYMTIDDMDKYYTSIVEVDAYAADTGRELLANVSDINEIFKNLNNEAFMQKNAPKTYYRYVALKQKYPKVWKRFLRRIYQYISERENKNFNDFYIYLANNIDHFAIKIGKELKNKNISSYDFIKNDDNIEYLKELSPTFKNESDNFEKYPTIWRNVSYQIVNYLNKKL